MHKKFTIIIGVIFSIFLFIFATYRFNKQNCDFRTPTDCYSCNAPNAIIVGTEENCTKVCPNRITNQNHTISGSGINCVLKDCPPDKPLRNYYGSCVSCDDLGEESWDYENCEICPERYLDKFAICRFKDGRKLRSTYFQRILEQQPQPCPSDKPLHQKNNECFSCNTPNRIHITSNLSPKQKKQLEAICPNRSIVNNLSSPFSTLNCPHEAPLIDSQGQCYSCNEKMAINVEYNTRFCARFCNGKRYLDGYLCSRCPEDKSALDEKQCQECGGSFTGNKCL